MVQFGMLQFACLSSGFFLAKGSVPEKCLGTGCEKEDEGLQPATSAQQLLQVTTMDRQAKGFDMNALQQLVAEGAPPVAVEKMLSLLQSDLVSGSEKPSKQHQAVLDFNKTLEDTLLKNIRDDHNLAQEQMNNLTDILAQCTSTFRNAGSRADLLKQDQASKKIQHEGCRATQVTLAAAYKTARTNFFDNFLNITKVPQSTRPASPNAAMDQYFKDMTQYWVQANDSYFDLKGKYESAQSTLSSHEKNCTSQQGNFETSYCAWHTSASDAIDYYQDCWSKANKTFHALRDGVLKMEMQRKTEYNSVRRMQCMLAFFLDSAKRGGNATSKLEACKHQTVNTSSLDLQNTTAASMDDVSSLGNLSLKPGDADWQTQEYSSIAVPSMLAKVQDCPSQKRPSAPKCADLQTTSRIWGLQASGINVSKYTRNTLQWIGVYHSSDFYCRDQPGGIEFGSRYQTVRAMLGNRVQTASHKGCCSASRPTDVCNAMDKNAEVDKLCKQMGFNSGTLVLRDHNSCPEIHYGASGWTSDFVRSSGAGRQFRCSGTGGGVPPTTPLQLLFTGKGTSSTYQNTWSGWYTRGSTVGSGDGKRGEYDTLKLGSIKFSDSSGKFAEYSLSSSYKGKSLRDIVVGCGLSSSSRNTRTGKWKTGHCSIGTLTSSSGLSNLNSVLRVGVGDDQLDALDWCVFMLKKGNGGGNFLGNRHHVDHSFSFGSEGHTAGSSNQVSIHGYGT